VQFPNTKKLLSVQIVCLHLLFAVLVSEVCGQQSRNGSVSEIQFTKEQNSENRQQKLKTQLIELIKIMELQQKILANLKAKLDQNSTELMKTALERRVADSERILKNAEVAFESIVTGGLDLEKFKEMPDQNFDWQSELIEIIQPIFQSLKDLTEQPRAMERVRKTIGFYQQNLSEIDDSIGKINAWSQAEVDLVTRQKNSKNSRELAPT
jgi:hypothetical protein